MRTDEITNFISGFWAFEYNNVLKNTFTQGYCYYFSVILRERFPGGRIVYAPIKGHFLYEINDSLYDITGIVETSDPYYDFEKYPDELQKECIWKDCVLKEE